MEENDFNFWKKWEFWFVVLGLIRLFWKKATEENNSIFWRCLEFWFIVLGLFSLLCYRATIWLRERCKEKESCSKMPPGPRSWPVVGNLLQLKKETPYLSLAKMQEKWGPVFSLRLGNVRCVVIGNARILTKLLRKEATTGRAPLYLTHGLMDGHGIICSEGEFWKEQRTWLLRILSTILKDHEPGVACSQAVLEHLQNTNLDEPIELSEVLGHYIGNFMNKIIFGKEYEKDNETWKYLQMLRDEGIKLIGVCQAVNFLPWLRFACPAIYWKLKWIEDGIEKTHAEYDEIINDREKRFDNGSDPNCVTDYYIIEMRQRCTDSNYRLSFTRKQLHYLQADLFGAGTDTTITSIMWGILALIRMPDVQEELYNALSEKTAEKHRSEEWDPENEYGRSHFTLLKAFLAEVGRLRPVTPLGVPHGTRAEVEITEADQHEHGSVNREGEEAETSGNTWVLPRGTMILPLHWTMNRDPVVLQDGDVEQFKLKRFIENKELFKYVLPFQTGKRRCPGAELGKNIVEKMFTELILKFKITTVDMSEADNAWHNPEHGFTLAPGSFKVKFEKRE